MGVLERIEANFVHLSPKEQLLATYIMQESPYFTNITISEMAKETGVSAATITRFCRKVGCESFVDLKIQLQASEGESAITKIMICSIRLANSITVSFNEHQNYNQNISFVS